MGRRAFYFRRVSSALIDSWPVGGAARGGCRCGHFSASRTCGTDSRWHALYRSALASYEAARIKFHPTPPHRPNDNVPPQRCRTGERRYAQQLPRGVAPLASRICDQKAWFAGIGGITLVRRGRIANLTFETPLPRRCRRTDAATDRARMTISTRALACAILAEDLPVAALCGGVWRAR